MPGQADIVVGLIFFVFVMLVFQYVGRYVITYRITDRSIQIRLFDAVPVSRVRFDRIKEIKVATPRDLWNPFDPVRFGNRITIRGVLIRRYGWLGLAITPDDPDEFVREVRQRLSQLNE